MVISVLIISIVVEKPCMTLTLKVTGFSLLIARDISTYRKP